MKLLNQDQTHAYREVTDAVNTDSGGVFFVYGYRGTGKTFLWRTLSASIRSWEMTVLNVASSGIGYLLLPGGRTTHSIFWIPLQINEDSSCNISQGTNLVELLIHTKLII